MGCPPPWFRHLGPNTSGTTPGSRRLPSVHEASLALLSDQSAPTYVKPRNPHFLTAPVGGVSIPRTCKDSDKKKGKMGDNSALFPYEWICIV